MAKRLGMPKRLRWERKTTQSAKAKLNRAEGQIVSRQEGRSDFFWDPCRLCCSRLCSSRTDRETILPYGYESCTRSRR